MLTRDYRPTCFQDVCGQPLAVEAMKAIIKDPERSPRVMIFHGEYGTGKTTLARIFARALNCTEHKWLCGTCAVCKDSLDFASFYQEFDSAVVGNKDDVLNIRDDLFMASYTCVHRVVVMDEFHLASKASQSAFLKVLEDLPPNVFVIFCTTQLQKVLPTIRSRAVELPFTLVPTDSIKEYLIKIVNSDGIDIDDTLLDLITERSRGHVRDAVMSLDTFVTLEDPQAFVRGLNSSREAAFHYLAAARTGNDVSGRIQALSQYPSEIVKQDLFQAITSTLEWHVSKDPEGRSQVRTEAGSVVGTIDQIAVGPVCEDTPRSLDIERNSQAPAPRQVSPGTVYLQGAICNIDTPSGTLTKVPETTKTTEAATTPNTKSGLVVREAPGRVTGAPYIAPSLTVGIGDLVRTLENLYQADLMNLVIFLSTDWACNALGDGSRIQALLWALHLQFRVTSKVAGPKYRKKRSE